MAVARPVDAFPVHTCVVVVDEMVMRCGEDLGSEELAKLPPGLRCQVLQHGLGADARRLRVRELGSGQEGWISCVARSGRQLLQLQPQEGEACDQPDGPGHSGHSGHSGQGRSGHQVTAEQPANAAFPVGSRARVLDVTVMRAAEDLHSDELGQLAKGQHFYVIAQGTGPTGRRLQVEHEDTGQVGWLSCVAQSGRALIELSDGPGDVGPPGESLATLVPPVASHPPAPTAYPTACPTACATTCPPSAPYTSCPASAPSAAPSTTPSATPFAQATLREAAVRAQLAAVAAASAEDREVPSVEAATEAEAAEAVRSFLVDNRTLKARTPGLGYRSSKRLDDLAPNRVAPWGTTLRGIDEGDGWLRVQSWFLPMWLEGVQVLTLQDVDAAFVHDELTVDGFVQGDWEYICVDPTGLRARSEPLYAKNNKSGGEVRFGEVVQVCERGRKDGFVWLSLADGRGWAFERTNRRRMSELIYEEVPTDLRMKNVVVLPSADKPLRLAATPHLLTSAGKVSINSGTLVRVVQQARVITQMASDKTKEAWRCFFKVTDGKDHEGWLPDTGSSGERLLVDYKVGTDFGGAFRGRTCWMSVLPSGTVPVLTTPGRSSDSGKKLQPGDFVQVVEKFEACNLNFFRLCDGGWVCEADKQGKPQVDLMVREPHWWIYVCNDSEGAMIRHTPTRSKTKNTSKKVKHRQRVLVSEQVVFSSGDVFLKLEPPHSGWVPASKTGGGVKMAQLQAVPPGSADPSAGGQPGAPCGGYTPGPCLGSPASLGAAHITNVGETSFGLPAPMHSKSGGVIGHSHVGSLPPAPFAGGYAFPAASNGPVTMQRRPSGAGFAPVQVAVGVSLQPTQPMQPTQPLQAAQVVQVIQGIQGMQGMPTAPAMLVGQQRRPSGAGLTPGMPMQVMQAAPVMQYTAPLASVQMQRRPSGSGLVAAAPPGWGPAPGQHGQQWGSC